MEFGEEVTEQINNAFKVLITDRFDRYVQNMLKNLDELNKIQEKVMGVKGDIIGVNENEQLHEVNEVNDENDIDIKSIEITE